jgi:hypothetical protein
MFHRDLNHYAERSSQGIMVDAAAVAPAAATTANVTATATATGRVSLGKRIHWY